MDEKFWVQYHFLETFSDAFVTEYTDDIEPQLADNFQYHCLDGVTHLDKSTFLQNFPNDLKHEFTVMMYVRKTAQPVLMFGPKCKNNRYPCVTVELGVDNKILSMTHSYAVLKNLISANIQDYAEFRTFCKMATSMPRNPGDEETQIAYAVGY